MILKFHSRLARKMVVPLIKVVNNKERSSIKKERCNVWNQIPMILPSMDFKQAVENSDADTERVKQRFEPVGCDTFGG